MNNSLLLPHRFKKIGWLILVPATLIGLYISVTGKELSWLNLKVFALWNDGLDNQGKYASVITNNISDELAGIAFIMGALLVGFSKEKTEDEYIANLRLSSLLWAVCLNYILLLLAFVFVYGFPFLTVMIYNMFTVMIIFIGRFNYLLFRNSKLAMHEK